MTGGAAALLLAAPACLASPAGAEEIHLDCARSKHTAMADIDAGRQFRQIMRGEGVAERYRQGDSYISGPDKYGRKERVVHVMGVDKSLVAFGTDRLCMDDGAGKCRDRHVRNTLDVARGEMKYDTGDEIAVLACHPVPPGRRFRPSADVLAAAKAAGFAAPPRERRTGAESVTKTRATT